MRDRRREVASDSRLHEVLRHEDDHAVDRGDEEDAFGEDHYSFAFLTRNAGEFRSRSPTAMTSTSPNCFFSGSRNCLASPTITTLAAPARLLPENLRTCSAVTAWTPLM